MSFLYRIFISSSIEDVRKKLNKMRLGKAHIVYGIGGEEMLELSRRKRIKSWDEKKIYSVPGVVNVKEEM